MTPRRTRAAVLLCLPLMLVGPASAAGAQTCLGLPDADVIRGTVGVTVDAGADSRAVVGRAGLVGRSRYAGVSAASIHHEDVGARSFVLGGAFGGIVRVETVERARLCPNVSVSYQWGPDFVVNSRDVRTSSITATGSLAVGMAIDVNPGFSLVPYGRVGVLTQNRARETENSRGFSRGTSTHIGGTVGAGLGFRFGDRFTVAPSVSQAVGFDDTKPLFALTTTLGFRRR